MKELTKNISFDDSELEKLREIVPWDKDEPSPTYQSKGVYTPPTIKNKERARTTPAPSQAIVVRLSDVEPEPISWLWKGRIALGKLTIISGDPGLGKSLLTSALAAIVSKGYLFPVDDLPAPVGDVVLLSAEDDPADTIRPRLDAAGADCQRIHILKAVKAVDEEGNPIQRIFSFKRDMEVLGKLLPTIPDCRLLVVDPISAYLDGTDSNNNSDVRGLFAPLAELAARHKIAVVLVSHLNKNSGGNALYRTMGSLAFVAAVRAAYVVTKDLQNPQRRLFLPVKNNLAPTTTGLAYSVITAENRAPLIAWEPELVITTADEALAPPALDEEKNATDEATDFLRGLLSTGAVKASDALKQAQEAGISKKSLRRAREKLGIQPEKTDFNGGWKWELPEGAQHSQGAQSENEGVFDNEGHLGNADETFNNL